MSRITFLVVLFSLVAFSPSMFSQPTTPSSQGQAMTEKKFSLTANKSRFCVGEAPRYAITGNADLAGKAIAWASSHAPFSPEPAPVQVNEGSYGQALGQRDGFSFWSGVGSIWTFAHQGQWTKTATIDGVSDAVKFAVDVCSPGDFSIGMRLSPESGSTLFYRLGTNSTQDIVVLLEGLVDPTVIRGWRVMVDNDNATKEVNGLLEGGLAEIFEVNDRQTFFQLPSGVAIRIPYPTRYLTPGSHEFRVMVGLVNGSEFQASAFYNVRPALETVGQYPNSLPDSKLYCDPAEGMSLTNQVFWFYARGGDGSYFWSAPGSETQAPNRREFPVSYSTPGIRNITVFSGGQSATCTVKVVDVPTPPMPAPSSIPRP